MSLLGAVELGGTKIRVARGDADGTILESDTFPTGGPDEAFARICGFFDDGPPVAAIGVGSFGPLVVSRGAADRGEMLTTPKPGWSGFNVLCALEPLGVPVELDTDVAAAGVGEHRGGALQGIGCGVYLTVGTGIGGALLVDGKVVNGAAHAEMGHVRLRRAAGDAAPSTCPYHPDCAEGLASGPAVQRRFGHTLSEATPDERALIGNYLGQLAAALVLVLSPQRIVVGGGVAKTAGLLDLARTAMLEELNGYAAYPELLDARFLSPPALGDDAGLTGALFLAAMREGQ
jgi:fructokinase